MSSYLGTCNILRVELTGCLAHVVLIMFQYLSVDFRQLHVV